jgi:hypothetical protein
LSFIPETIDVYTILGSYKYRHAIWLGK